jgi:DNA-binding transcriptional LysR family regulator
MTQRVGQIERTMSIGFVASTLYGMLPKIIRNFRSQYSLIELKLHEMTTMEQIQALKEGIIDVGFGRIRHQDQNVRRIVLREERLMVAVPAGHPLTQSGGAAGLKDLVAEKLIIFPKAPRPSFADQVLEAFRDRGLLPEKVLEVRELQIAIGLVAAGEGIAIVPNSLHGLQRSDVDYVELNEHNVMSPIIMSVRMLDRSEDLQSILALIYDLYDAEGIAHVKEVL